MYVDKYNRASMPLSSRPARNPLPRFRVTPDTPDTDGNFGFLAPLIQAATAAYSVKAQKSMQRRALDHQDKLAKLAQQTEEKRMALEALKINLTSRAQGLGSTLSDPKVMIALGAVALLGVGTLIYIK